MARIVVTLQHSARTILIIAAAILGPGGGRAEVWLGQENGPWNDPANWGGTVPNASGAVATFGPDAPNNNINVSVDGATTLAVLESTNPHFITLSGPEAVRFATGSPADAVLRTGQGADRVHLLTPTVVDATGLTIDAANLSSILVSGRLDGAATLRKTGPGVLELTGSNVNWSGPIVVEGGWLKAGDGSALGDSETGTLVQPNGTLELLRPSSEPIHVHSGAVYLNYAQGAHLGTISMQGGTLRGTVHGFPELQGPLEIVGGSTVTIDSSRPAQIVLSGGVQGTGTLRFRSSIDNHIRDVGLNHDGDVLYEMQDFANAVIQAPGSYAGGTTINSGGVMVEHPDGLGSSSVGTVLNDGGLALNADSLEPVEVRGGIFYLWAQSPSPTYTPPIHMYGGELDAFSFLGDTITVGQPVTIHGGATVSFRSSSQDILALAGGITGHGDVVLNPYHEIQVLGPIATTGDVTILSTTHFHAANAFPGALTVENGPLIVHVDNTVQSLEILNGRLSIVDGATLTAHEIRLRRGIIDGPLAGVDTLYKLGLDVVELINLGPDFDPNIVIPEGVVFVSGESGLGRVGHSTQVTGNRNAALQIPQLLTSDESIELRNATGFGLGGGLVLKRTDGSAEPAVLTGNVDLGTVGSTIGLPDVRLRLDGAISGGALTARGFGLGQLILTGDDYRYTGPTELLGVGLVLQEQGVLEATSAIRAWAAGEIIIDNGVGGTLANRLHDDIPVHLHGARLTLQGRDDALASETIGCVTLENGASEIAAIYEGAASSSTLTISQLERQVGATAHFLGINMLGGADGASQVLLANSPQLDDGILGGWATIFSDFATYGDRGVTALQTYEPDLLASAATSNVNLEQSLTMAEAMQINSLRIGGAEFLDLGGHTLAVNSGGLLKTGYGGEPEIRNGQITAGTNGPAEFFMNLKNPIIVAATIADNPGGPVTLVKSGPATLTLTGTNTHTGATYLNQGDVILRSGGNLAATSALHVNGATLSLQFENAPVLSVSELHVRNDSATYASSGQSLHADNVTLESGTLYVSLAGTGSLRKTTPGVARLVADNREFTGDFQVEDGILSVEHAFGLGGGSHIVQGGGYLALGSQEMVGNITLAGGVLALGASQSGTVLSGYIDVVEDSGIDLLEINMTDRAFPRPLVLQGQLTIEEGRKLEVTGHPNGPLSVLGGITLQSGARLSGSASVDGLVQLADGASIDPGNSPGEMQIASMSWAAGGMYVWEINDADGREGAPLGRGWDLLAINALTVSSEEPSPFTIQVVGLGLDNEMGAIDNFDPARDYAWRIAQTAELAGFTPKALHLDLGSFLLHNPVLPGAAFEVFADGADVMLAYRVHSTRGDYNGDGRVDQADLDLVLLNWGASAETPPANWTTMVPTGRVDQDELDGVLLHWGDGIDRLGRTPGRSALGGVATPEPAAIALLVICILIHFVSRGILK